MKGFGAASQIMLQQGIPFPTNKLIASLIFLPCVVTVFIVVPKPIYSLTVEMLYFNLTILNLKNSEVS